MLKEKTNEKKIKEEGRRTLKENLNDAFGQTTLKKKASDGQTGQDERKQAVAAKRSTDRSGRTPANFSRHTSKSVFRSAIRRWLPMTQLQSPAGCQLSQQGPEMPETPESTAVTTTPPPVSPTTPLLLLASPLCSLSTSDLREMSVKAFGPATAHLRRRRPKNIALAVEIP